MIIYSSFVWTKAIYKFVCFKFVLWFYFRSFTLKETGSVNDRPWSGRPGSDQETVASVEDVSVQRAQKSLKLAPLELDISKIKVHKFLKSETALAAL
jgi:hypothetical protein